MVRIKNEKKGSLRINVAGKPPIILKAGESFEFKTSKEYVPYEKVVVNLIKSGAVSLEAENSAKKPPVKNDKKVEDDKKKEAADKAKAEQEEIDKKAKAAEEKKAKEEAEKKAKEEAEKKAKAETEKKAKAEKK